MIRIKNLWKVFLIIFSVVGLLMVASPASAATPTPSSSNAANKHDINLQRQNLVRTFVQAIHAANTQFNAAIHAAVQKLHADLAAATNKPERVAAINAFQQSIRKAVVAMQAAKTAAREAFLAGLRAL